MQSFLPLPQSATGVFQKWRRVGSTGAARRRGRACTSPSRACSSPDRPSSSPASRRRSCPAGPAPSRPRCSGTTCRRSRVLRLRGEHPRVEPAGGALLRDRSPRPAPLAFSVPGREPARSAPSQASPLLISSALSARADPVLLDQRPLLLEQVHDRVELRLVQLVGILDPERGLRLHQVQRGVGDLDRVVRDRDPALVLRAVDRRPARRRRLDLVRPVEQRVRPELERDAVVLAVDRVVRRRLERRKNCFHSGTPSTSTG